MMPLRLHVVVASLLALGGSIPGRAEGTVAPDQALARLLEGNRRFAAGAPAHPDQSVTRRAAVAGRHAPGHIHSIVESIAPALETAAGKPGDKVDNAVRANACRVADLLRRAEPIVCEAVKAGQVKVVAGRYDLATGRVELLP